MSVLDCLRSTPPHYRISIEDAIREASPDYADETIERSKDHLENLKKLRLLRKYPHLNDAKALAIIAYMLDLGMTYEHSIYYKLRDALREGDEGAIRTVKGCLLHLLAALRSINPVSNDKPLYRVIDGKTYNLDKYHVGNRVSWPAFTTTVRDISVARKNIRGKGQPIFFEIRGSYRGYYLKDFSVSMDEDVILEPDTTVVVKEINPANKGHGNIITFVLEVVSSPPVLSEVVRNFNAANHPDTTLVADVQSVPEGWKAKVDEKSGQYYYANLVTKTTQWEFPKEPVALNSSHEFSSVTVSNDRFSSCVEFDEKFSSLDEAKKNL